MHRLRSQGGSAVWCEVKDFSTTPLPAAGAHPQAKGKAVYLVSGGFTQMIFPVAALLGLPKEHVFANTILFDAAGKYAGFDREAFTSRSGGKARGEGGGRACAW